MTADSVHQLVSFIVPTLNRGRYVIRAIESCLMANREAANVDVEVIVVDSESDDGSWQALCARFGSDLRVKLVQNRRGVGPTRSWLDGGRLIRGDFVTFVWSDDYISPRFLTELVPPLRSGSCVAVGHGLLRDIDNETAFPPVEGSEDIAPERFVVGYFFGRSRDNIERPVSPVCSLFTRSAFEAWISVVEEECRATTFRRRVMWDSGIGPDFLLYLVAASQTQNNLITLVSGYTAQFSHHSGSITIRSPQWLLATGYWLAGVCFLSSKVADTFLSPRAFIRCLSADFAQGIGLTVAAKREAGTKAVDDNRGVLNLPVIRELIQLWNVAGRHQARIAVLRYVLRRTFRKVRRILGRRINPSGNP